MTALFDPALLIVVAASAVFFLLVVLTVSVMRWVMVRRNPEISDR